MRIEFTIPVNPRPKKNSPMILWRKQDFKIKIGARVLATIPFTPFNRSTKHTIDLTNLNEALHDAMVKSGCILDDNRDIIAAHDGSRVFYDKFNPRIEVVISEMENYHQWNDTTSEQKKLL